MAILYIPPTKLIRLNCSKYLKCLNYQGIQTDPILDTLVEMLMPLHAHTRVYIHI